ncbi:MAG: GlsB/YeaQ/YmgE family stress response membrane protein, partial [Actinomycetes bacterium]
MFSILAYIVIGMVAGWAASLLVRHDMHPNDWGTLFLLGIGSSVIAGIIINLIMGQGFKLQPGGVIAS